MPNAGDIPPDIRSKLGGGVPTAGPTGRPFIGSNHPGYPGARQPTPVPKSSDETSPDGTQKDEAATATGAPCARCKAPLVESAAFCRNCGLDLQRKRAAEALGITISDEDVQAYLFKGYLVKEVTLFGTNKVTFKSLQAKELDEADALTETHFKDRRPLDLDWVNYRAKILIAFGLVKLNGTSIGDTAQKRLEYLQDHGSHFAEAVGKKFQLFNTAISEVLNGDVLGKS